METSNIVVRVREFSISPGSRYIDEGKNAYSGEEFREQWLEPKLDLAINEEKELIVDLDGTLGYGTSWLEEVFGGLVRKGYTKEQVSSIKLITREEPYLEEDIKGYIENA